MDEGGRHTLFSGLQDGLGRDTGFGGRGGWCWTTGSRRLRIGEESLRVVVVSMKRQEAWGYGFLYLTCQPVACTGFGQPLRRNPLADRV